MNILFLCGSLEPGLDGVGDYVRMLGEELSRAPGCSISAVAINDPYVSVETYGHVNTRFPILRIPAAWAPVRRLETAVQYAGQYRPDWVSVQFVPYAYHAKGLPVYLGRHLETLTRNARVHFMLHEAWVGTGDGFRPDRMVQSFMQKMILKQLLDRLSPSVIHTHLPEYQQKLARLQHPALDLPLFSNIRPAAFRQTAPDRFVIGFFSQMACTAQIKSFLDSLARNAVSAGIAAEVLLIGGREAATGEFRRFIRTMPYFRNRVTCTGFLSPEEISGAIQGCSLGITPVPRHALGKSGSVAAFLSHGIPVAAPHVQGNGPRIPGFFSPVLEAAILTEPDLESLERARTVLITGRHEIRVGRITRKLLHDLNQPYQL